MTRFNDLTTAYIAQKRAAQLEWFAYQGCALHLIKMLKSVGGIDHESLQTETLEGRNAQGRPFDDYIGWINDWMHLRLRFVIPVPVNLARPDGPTEDRWLGVILQYRHQKDGWVIRFYDDDEPRPFVPEDDASVRAICETLYSNIIEWLARIPPFEGDTKRIGFHTNNQSKSAQRAAP